MPKTTRTIAQIDQGCLFSGYEFLEKKMVFSVSAEKSYDEHIYHFNVFNKSLPPPGVEGYYFCKERQ